MSHVVTIEFFLASASLPFHSQGRILNLVKESGFDGVEWLLLRDLDNAEKIHKMLEMSGTMNVGATFHRMWENPCLSLYMLKAFRQYPKTLRVNEIFLKPLVLPYPVVNFMPYEDEWLPGTMVQTGGNMIKGLAALSTLVEKVRHMGLKLAFDPMHALETEFGDYRHVSGLNRQVIKNYLERFALQNNDIIDEMHVYNFQPTTRMPLPIIDIFYKNLPPNADGMLNIHELVRSMIKHHWRGRLVLELHPRFLMVNTVATLKKCRQFLMNIYHC